MTPPRGLGTYSTAAEAALAAKVALTAAVHAALDDVDDPDANPPVVVDGDAYDALGVLAGDDVVGVDIGGTSLTTGTVATARREQHTVKLVLTVVAYRVTEDVAETLTRAWQLLALVDQHVRTAAPTLDGAVLWARITSTDAGSAPRKISGGYSGRVSMVEATVECGVIAAVG